MMELEPEQIKVSPVPKTWILSVVGMMCQHVIFGFKAG